MGDRGRPIRGQLLMIAALMFSALLSVTVVGLVAVNAEETTVTKLAEVTGPAISLNSAIRQTMASAETGLQGYLRSGNPALLALGDQQQALTDQNRLSTLLAGRQLGAASRGTYQRQLTAQAAGIAGWWRYAAAARASGTRTQPAALLAGEAIFNQFRAANIVLASGLNSDQAGLVAQAGRTHTTSVAALVAATLLVLLAGFAAIARIARTVTNPIVRLRQVVQHRNQGDAAAHAEEDRGPAEIRSLAIAFNEAAARNAELAAEQAEELRLQNAVFGAGHAIRYASSGREAMAITCAQLGAALSARRVMATTLTAAPKITAGAQWHAPDLDDLPDVPEDLAPRLWRSASELWTSGGRIVINDLLTGETAQQDWALRFHRETGATALIMVPLGLGSQIIGALYVVADTGPRQWTRAEAGTVERLASYLSMAITETADKAHRAEYTARLEGLDRQKSEFLATVSHELRTPLTSIQGYLELLSDGDAGPMPGEQKQMLDIIERNTVRLRGLIEDILVLNRVETGSVIASFSEVTLAALVTSTAEDLQPMADKAGVRLYLSTDADPACLRGDQSLLQRALVNIVSNAIKFTPRDGTVRLSCATDPVVGEGVVTCQDTGIGIPQADREHLFTRFFRASNAVSQVVPGTGLGLVIVQAVVEAHGGRLTVDSAEGKGTTVTLRFPLGLPAS